MSAKIKADGDTWRARLGEEGEGAEPIVLFFCESTDQRPYRVAEVEPGRFAGPDDLDRAGEEELQTLYRASRSMGSPRDYPTYGS